MTALPRRILCAIRTVSHPHCTGIIAAAMLTSLPGIATSGELDLGLSDQSVLSDAKAEEAAVIPESGVKDRDLTYPIIYVGTKQLIGLGLLTTLDDDVTMFESFSVDTFKDGWRRGPEWDDDEWYWNYLGHPLWGSETFLRARSQNFSFIESFAFSTAASVVWEFGMENWTSNPSTQDLLLTSTAGSLIGEFRFHVLKKLAGRDDPKSKTLRFVFDPLQSTAKFVGKKWFGADLEEPAFKISPTVNAEGDVGVNGSVSIKF